jgi:filamin
LQSFDILLSHHVKPSDLHVSVTSPPLGSIEKQLDWSSSGNQQANKSKCTVSFKVPTVGIYNIRVELLNQQLNNNCVEFQAKAYDLSKVLIQNSSGQCRVNDSYEFGVDASEAGEGQLEIAVNEGEIPNQVQVLDNGKCIVNFVPEESVPHVVDIKFNGHNVIGCPFVVQVDPVHGAPQSGSAITETDTRTCHKDDMPKPHAPYA